MNAIDIDELNKTIKECTASLYDTEDILEEILFLIDYAPVVEAIPIEYVARIIDFVTALAPCHYGDTNIDWCKSQNCKRGKTDFYDCWLHALKEGWLDETS